MEKDYTSLFEYLIYNLAGQGQVIIVGRGAQVVLREIPGVYKIRVVAPQKLRIQRFMEQNNISMERSKALVNQIDHQRDGFIQSIYGQDPSDWRLYDHIINTQSIIPKNAAEIICFAIDRAEPIPEDDFQKNIRQLILAKRVENAIRKEIASVGGYQISASCPSFGTIKISGFVPKSESKARAENLARSIDGVDDVINDIHVYLGALLY